MKYLIIYFFKEIRSHKYFKAIRNDICFNSDYSITLIYTEREDIMQKILK